MLGFTTFVLALLATVASSRFVDLENIVVGEAPRADDRFVVLSNPASVWLSCGGSAETLFWTDNEQLPILASNPFFMASAGWQKLVCSVTPTQIETTSTRVIIQLHKNVYFSTVKRSFPYSLVYDLISSASDYPNTASSSVDICFLTTDTQYVHHEFVLSWDNPNVTGW